MAAMDCTEILEIDGSVLEGGGQILRISIALSALLKIPVRVKNIRSGRPKPGLAAQHLKGIELVGAMCNAKMKGVKLGSTKIEFIPGQLKGGTFHADTQTAGSISLLIQAALPCAMFAPEPVTLELKGGTNTAMAPQIDYMVKVFAPMLRNFGGDFCVEIIKRGYFPRGGGHVRVTLTPVRRLRSVRILDRGELERITGWSYVAGVTPQTIAQHMTQSAKIELWREVPVYIHTYKEGKDVARDNGWGIILVAELSSGCVLGADGLGTRDVDADTVGRDAASALLDTLATGSCLDPYAQDQVIVYMALATGQSAVRVGELTLHTRTAIHIAQRVAAVEFNIIPLSDQNVIQCVGRGLVNVHVQ